MLRIIASLLAVLSPVLAGQPSVRATYRFPLADCDSVAYGPEGDLFFACHSPDDRLPGTVRGAKPTDTMDGYVLRIRPSDGHLVYATRIGGSSFDAALRVAVDRTGRAFTTGITRSADYPVSTGAMQKALRGGADAFLTVLSPSGEILYSTYLGGSGDDIGGALDLGPRGEVYLGGSTSSSDLPGSASRTAGGDDAFLCRVEVEKPALQCTAFGGRGTEKLTGLAVDGKGGIWTVGGTGSHDFPLVKPKQRQLRGKNDLFLTRFDAASLRIQFSTLFGGSGDDTGWGITLDRAGNPVVAGITDSPDLPGTVRGFQPAIGGKRDAFVARFTGRGHRSVSATYLGGSADDEAGYDGGNVQAGRDGTIWLAGITYSKDFPAKNPVQPWPGHSDASGFVTAFDAGLRRLCFATWFGRPERQLLEGVAIGPAGEVAVTGVSFSPVPDPMRVQLGSLALFAGHHVAILDGAGACSTSK